VDKDNDLGEAMTSLEDFFTSISDGRPMRCWKDAMLEMGFSVEDSNGHSGTYVRGRHSARIESMVQAETAESLEEDVIQAVVHDEPGVQRDPTMLQLQADHSWALQVERCLHGLAAPDVAADEESSVEQEAQDGAYILSGRVYLCSFRSGQWELFRKMILQDKEFRTLRQNLGAKMPVVLHPSGALILVRPEQYFDTINALKVHTLKRYMVVVAESEEYLLEEVLARMKSKQRPRENVADRKMLFDGELDLDLHFIFKRTFVCIAPELLAAGTVAQSTTEAQRSSSASSSNYLAHTRGENPRRRALA